MLHSVKRSFTLAKPTDDEVRFLGLTKYELSQFYHWSMDSTLLSVHVRIMMAPLVQCIPCWHVIVLLGDVLPHDVYVRWMKSFVHTFGTKRNPDEQNSRVPPLLT